MNFIRKIFQTEYKPVRTYDEFWNWFCKHEKPFFRVVKNHQNIEQDFFNQLTPKLDGIKEGFYFLAGMYDDNIAELVITADGVVKNIVFAEELVSAAPPLKGWKFTALKPALDIENVSIDMQGYQFNDENLSFYSNDNAAYPDEIGITVVHNDLTEENKTTITNGTFIFLDNFLGELGFATTIDNLAVIGKATAEKELIPIAKLKNFLLWRQKEFIEKYEGVRHQTDEDGYATFEGRLQNGQPLIATINTDLLQWYSKASHPWIMVIEIKYNGEDNNGMPDEETYRLLNEIEDQVCRYLKDYEGYLNIGRQTADNVREIYFACKEFRKPSKVVYALQQQYTGSREIIYDIYKDKYWQSFNRFDAGPE